MAEAGGGPHPARAGAEPLPQGRVRPSRDPQGGGRPARTHPAQSVLPAGDDRPPRAARHLGAYRRHRHRAGRRRVVLRARGQRPNAVRRLLHAGKPRSDDAAPAGSVRPAPRRAGRRLSRRAARLPALGRPANGSRRGDDRAPDARALQFRLLRALVPRRQARRRAGRGPRSVRRGRSGLHAHDARAAPGRRDLPPGRRRFSRSAGLQSVVGAGRAGTGRRLFGGQCDARECNRHRRRRRQGDLQLRPRSHPLLPVRRAAVEERADLSLPRARRAQIRARAARRAGGQGGQRFGRLRHAGRPARHRRAARAVRGQDQGRSDQLHRPADAGALDLSGFVRERAFRRGTSICGRSCSPAPTACGSSPAA